MKIYLAYATILIALITSFYFLFLAFWPVKLMTITNNPYPILTPMVVQGQDVEFNAKYCVYKVATGEIVRYLIGPGNSLILLAPSAYTTKIGCNDTDTYVTIPDTVPPGIYNLFTTATYQVTPLHTVIEQSATQSFTVISNHIGK